MNLCLPYTKGIILKLVESKEMYANSIQCTHTFGKSHFRCNLKCIYQNQSSKSESASCVLFHSHSPANGAQFCTLPVNFDPEDYLSVANNVNLSPNHALTGSYRTLVERPDSTRRQKQNSRGKVNYCFYGTTVYLSFSLVKKNTRGDKRK